MKYSLLDKIFIVNELTLKSRTLNNEQTIIQMFVDTTKDMIGADYGYAERWNHSTKEFELTYKDKEIPYEPLRPRKNGMTARAFRRNSPIFVDGTAKASILRSHAKKFMKGVVVIPIVYESERYGVIDVCFYKKHVFTEEERTLCEYIGNSAAQAITIERSKKKLLGLMKHKDEFFNVASHELKTPVTTIKGFAQLLTDLLEKSDPRTKYFLGKINHQVDKLTRLINDLLDISRIETGKLVFEKNNFELDKLMRQTIEGLAVAVKSHPISFSSEGKFWIRGDNERIEEVLINLVTNAAKYSPPGSKIKICLRKKNEKACVEVEDFGYGIKKKDQSKIFNRFFQSKQSDKQNPPGLGLGLYIANSIVKGHGGTMDFKNKVGNTGTVFFFQLPYYKAERLKNKK